MSLGCLYSEEKEVEMLHFIHELLTAYLKCLSFSSIPVKRHKDVGKFSKRQHLTMCLPIVSEA